MILHIHEEIRTTLGLDSVVGGFPLSIDQIRHLPGHVCRQILEIAQINGLLFYQNIMKVNN